MRLVAAALLLVGALAAVCSATGVYPKGYTCDPATCKGACACPSNAAPGGLALADTPQFVLITHDDAVSPLGNKGVRSVTDGFKNPNGCNIPATWFVTQDGSECPLVKALHDQNHEIAIHTVHHAQLSVGFKGLEQEMMGVRDWLHSDCGIPLEDMRGFRSPYLVNNEPVRQVLAKNGFLYDSSINEFVGEDSPATKTFGQRLWPYTMDNGIGQLCNWTYPDGQCFSTERYPGMWEVPMWDLPFTNDPAKTEESAYTMDYGAGFGGDVFTTLSTNFDAAYNGNRAPFPLFVHAPWFGKPASNTANAIKFMQYALSKPNVYFVTIQQLLAWMANPVPASQLATTLTCKPVDLTVPVTPSCQVYTVKAGDFLEKIAGQFGIAEVTDLVAVNPGLSASNIVPNQKIKIPPFPASCGAGSAEGTVPAAVPAAAVAVAAAPAPAAVEPVVQCPTWTVESGQYLDGIAAAAKASAADIMKLNGMSAATAGELSIGQVLKMPPYADCCATNSCEQPAPVAASDALPAAEPAAAAAPLSQSVVMGFYFAGMSPAMFEAEGQAPFVNAVSQLLGAPASAITAAVVPVRRRRALHSAADLVAVDVTVATADALATYKQADSTLKSGTMESAFNAVGLTLQGPPRMTLFKDGAPLALPAAGTAGAASTAAAPAGDAKSLPLPLGALIGAAVGGVVVLAAVIAGVVVCCKKRRAASREVLPAHAPPAGYVGGSASLSIRTSFKSGPGADRFAVLKSGNNSPTVAVQRTSFQ